MHFWQKLWAHGRIRSARPSMQMQHSSSSVSCLTLQKRKHCFLPDVWYLCPNSYASYYIFHKPERNTCAFNLWMGYLCHPSLCQQWTKLSQNVHLSFVSGFCVRICVRCFWCCQGFCKFLFTSTRKSESCNCFISHDWAEEQKHCLH